MGMVRWYWTQRVRGAFSATRSTSTTTILSLKFIPLNDHFKIELSFYTDFVENWDFQLELYSLMMSSNWKYEISFTIDIILKMVTFCHGPFHLPNREIMKNEHMPNLRYSESMGKDFMSKSNNQSLTALPYQMAT